MKSKQLARRELDDAVKSKALDQLMQATGDVTPESFAKSLSLPISHSLEILSDDGFVSELRNRKIQLARIFLNTSGINELSNIILTGTPRDRIAAVKLLSEIVGYREKGPVVAIQQNFEARELQPGDPGWIESLIRQLK